MHMNNGLFSIFFLLEGFAKRGKEEMKAECSPSYSLPNPPNLWQTCLSVIKILKDMIKQIFALQSQYFTYPA